MYGLLFFNILILFHFSIICLSRKALSWSSRIEDSAIPLTRCLASQRHLEMCISFWSGQKSLLSIFNSFENSIMKRNIIEYISKGKSAFFMVYGFSRIVGESRYGYHGTGKTYTLYGSLEEFFGSAPVPPLSSYLPVKSRSALLKRKGEDSKTVNSKAFNAFLLDEFHGVIIHTANAIFEYIKTLENSEDIHVFVYLFVLWNYML